MSEVTDELVERWAQDYYENQPTWPSQIKGRLKRAIDAGWTIEPPPEPRYYSTDDGYVMDRVTDHRLVARFYPEHPDLAGAAEREAAYLNSTRGGDR